MNYSRKKPESDENSKFSTNHTDIQQGEEDDGEEADSTGALDL
jgi:hypothetical protein